MSLSNTLEGSSKGETFLRVLSSTTNIVNQKGQWIFFNLEEDSEPLTLEQKERVMKIRDMLEQENIDNEELIDFDLNDV